MHCIRPKIDKQNHRVSIMDGKYSANHEFGLAVQTQENIGTLQVDSKPTQVSVEYPQSETSEREVTGKHQSICQNHSDGTSDHSLSQENHNNPVADTNDSTLSDAVLDTGFKCNQKDVDLKVVKYSKVTKKKVFVESINERKVEDKKFIPIHPQVHFGQITGGKDSILTQTSQFIPHNETSEMVILRRRTINDEKYQKIESNVNEAKQIDGTAKENIDKTKEIIDNRAKDTNGFNVSDALLDTDVEIDPTNIDVDQPVKYQCCNKSTSETEPEIEINVTETKNNHGPIAEDEGTNIVNLSQISERNLLPQTSDIEAVNYIEPLNKCSSEEKQFTHDSPQGNQNRGYLNHEFKQKENSFCEWSNVKLKSKDYPRYNAITNASKLISKKSEFKELTENAVQYIHFDTMSGLIIVADNIYIYHYGYCQSVLIRGERKITFTKMSRYSLVMTKSSLYCLKQTAWLFEEVDNPKSIYFCAEMASVVIYAVPYLPTSYLDLAHYFNRPVERENRNSNTGELLDPLRIGNTVSTSQDHTDSNRDDGTMSRSGATSIVALERRNILMGVQNRNRNHFLHYRYQMLSSYFQMQRSNRHSLAMYQHNMYNSRAQHRYRSLNHTQTEPPGMRLPHLFETVSYEGQPRTRVVAVRPEASGRSHNIENEIKTGTRTSQHSNTRVTIVDPEATERRLYMENELSRGTLMAQGSDTLFSAEQFETHVTVLPPSESRPITETVNQTVRTPGTQGSDTLTPAERFETRVTFVPPSKNRPLTETENQTESSTRGSSGHHGTGAIRFCTCCDVKVIAVMFLPCRHAVCCKDCSERFTVCDQCRMPIKDRRSLN